MPSSGPERIRNVAILGHSHEGKTTLAEALLHALGALPRMGSTELGTAALDFEPEEQRHKISVDLGIGHVESPDLTLNLLDTPGFLDFGGQVDSALAVAEGALLVMSPTAEVSLGAEIAWGRLNRRHLPRLIVINKVDKESADFLGAVSVLQEQLQPRPIAIQIPIVSESGLAGAVDLVKLEAITIEGQETAIPESLQATVQDRHQQLIEAAAEADDRLLERYLDGRELTAEEITVGLSRGVAIGRICPVLAASASHAKGIQSLIRAIRELLPPPSGDAKKPPRLFAFRTAADPFVGRVTYLKVMSGCVTTDQRLLNVTRGEEERLGHLFFPLGKEHLEATQACAGDIVGVAKLQHTFTNDMLGAEGPAPRIEFPEPVYGMSVIPRNPGDEDRIFSGLTRLAEEDPSLHLERTDETHQVLIRGQGDVHLQVALEKLERKHGAAAFAEPPRVAYRETISGKTQAEGRHVKQSGGHGQYAICQIEVEPAARGEGFVWEDRIFGGSIPHNFRPSVHRGIQEAIAKGVIAGYPMVDIKVGLVDGKHHPVDSSDMAFQIAGALAIRKAATQAGAVLLEPVDEVEVRAPEQFLGDIMADLNGKRGRITGAELNDGEQVIHAQVPQVELLRFAIDLRSITQGRGCFRASFLAYEAMPSHLSKPLIDAFQKEHGSKE